VEFVVAVMPIPTTGVLSKADRGQGELEHNPPPTETRHHDDGTAAKVLPLEKVADGYQRMVTNQARFRVVLTTAH
jgi:hypothetical protein